MTDVNSTPRAYTIQGFCAAYGVGRSYAYNLIAEGHLQVRKAGRRTLIPADAADAWLNSLPSEREA